MAVGEIKCVQTNIKKETAHKDNFLLNDCE